MNKRWTIFITAIIAIVFCLIQLSAMPARVEASAIVCERVVGDNMGGGRGFGDTNNKGIFALAVFKGNLYAGTHNEGTGIQIWRTSNGLSWENVISGGFGNAANSEVYLTVFKDKLYAGTYSYEQGCVVWRTDNGSDWAPVVGPSPALLGPGFNDPNNWGVLSLTVFKDSLYAGTQNMDSGAEIWRTEDGITWLQTNSDGFGYPDNQETHSLTVFDGLLYGGIWNRANGAEIWRTADGANWVPVVGRTPGITASGFGDANNTEPTTLAVFKEYLYDGTLNSVTGTETWRSKDGLAWEQIGSDGFGDPANIETYSAMALGDYLYHGTRNEMTGTEIWRTQSGTDWIQINKDGFGATGDLNATAMAAFNGYLYIGVNTDDNGPGAEIWRVRDPDYGKTEEKQKTRQKAPKQTNQKSGLNLAAWIGIIAFAIILLAIAGITIVIIRRRKTQ